MMKMTRLAFVMVCLAAGCGGSSGSGVDSSKVLITLDDSEAQQICDYATDVTGGPRTVQCDDGEVVELFDAAECVESLSLLSDSCGGTVDDFEACAEAVGDDPCNPDISACLWQLECI